MEIFWRLVFAHLLGDFTFQTNAVAQWKRRSEWGLLFHVIHHPILYLIIAYPFLTIPWITTPWFSLNGVWAILLIGFLHWVEDKSRVWTVGRSHDTDNMRYFALDQFIHLFVIYLLTPRITTMNWPQSWSQSWPQLWPPLWLALCILAALCTHFANIVVYFIEKDLHGQDRANVLLTHKHIFMAERLVLAGTLLLPGWWGMLFLVALFLQWLRHKMLTSNDFTWISVVGGNLIAIACGILGRLIIF